ncbi:MAG: HIT domain-containing protein [Candidatus Levybacteria bacterium]|nr:HIT domain-containing protein [Candidatus Levybacteria bacterium]
MNDCVFCKIVRGEIPKDFRYEDDVIVAFDDVRPQADIHVLFTTRKHIDAFESLKDDKILSSVRIGIQKIASENKLVGRGYKILVFGGGAQTIDHLHFHLIGPVGLQV